jgi:hypothetical protein
MAILSTINPTLADVASRLDPNGEIAAIVELLRTSSQDVIDSLTFLEGNLPTGHRTTVRTGIPTPTWRRMYGGVQPARSTTAQVTDTIGMLEAYSEVDKALADLNGNTAAFRMSEDIAHLQGMSDTVASTLFYGNEGLTPEAFTGLAPRFNSLSAPNGTNIIDAFSGSGGNLTSIWLCVWGPQTGYNIYPKGSQAGLKRTDKGLVTIENVDGNGGRMEAYRTHYRWDVGLVVADWRYFVRIANINVSDLNNVANQKALINYMVMATERIPNFSAGRAAFYVNRTIREKLRLGILERISSNLSWETVSGKRVMTFDDIPVYRADALINTESRVI